MFPNFSRTFPNVRELVREKFGNSTNFINFFPNRTEPNEGACRTEPNGATFPEQLPNIPEQLPNIPFGSVRFGSGILSNIRDAIQIQ